MATRATDSPGSGNSHGSPRPGPPWLPCAGIPPASRIMRVTCMRSHVMKVVLRFVKSFSGPPESGSR